MLGIGKRAARDDELGRCLAVAEVCELTAYCAYRDIHPNTKGYALIADLIAKTLPHKH